MIKVLEDFHHFPYISIHLHQTVSYILCTMYEIYLIHYILSHCLYLGTLITKKAKQIKKIQEKNAFCKVRCNYHIWVIEGYTNI